MGESKGGIKYSVEIEPEAVKDLKSLGSTIRRSIAEKIDWIAENAEVIRHTRLKHLPKDLKGLCKYRVSDYRVLYWVYPQKKIIKVYGIIHRSTKYRLLLRKSV